jgi:hypothetical protein
MRFFKRPPKESVQAIGDDKFEGFLDSLGVLESIKSGNVKCKFCRDVVTVDSISYVLPDGGSIKFVCDKPECTSSLLEYINEGKGV